jgi:tetratricopeptide (TPR) repeat protein
MIFQANPTLPMSQNRLEMILEMLDSNPEDPFLRYAAALEYIKLEDKETAIGHLKYLYKEDPEYLATYYQLGKLLEEKGKPSQAIRVYKKGKTIAQKQQDSKTLGELEEALMILDVYDEEL